MTIDLFQKWRLLHENEAGMFFNRSELVSNRQTDLTSFLVLRVSAILAEIK